MKSTTRGRWLLNPATPISLTLTLTLALTLASTLAPADVSAVGSAESFDEGLMSIYEGRTEVIGGTELWELMRAGAVPDQVYLLDIRSEEEWQVSRLAGAEYIGYRGFSLDQVAHIPRDATVVLYCAVGWRSGRVERQMRDAGFTDVRDLYGGIFRWVNDGFPVIDTTGETMRVHGHSPRWGRWIENPQVEVIY